MNGLRALASHLVLVLAVAGCGPTPYLLALFGASSGGGGGGARPVAAVSAVSVETTTDAVSGAVYATGTVGVRFLVTGPIPAGALPAVLVFSTDGGASFPDAQKAV